MIAVTTWSTSGRAPSSNRNGTTSAPKASAILIQRSPKLPAEHAQHPVTRGQRVGEGGLERAGARRGEHEDVAGGPVDGLQLLDDPAVQPLELRGAVVRQRAGHGRLDLRAGRVSGRA